ncbi:MAG: ribonuclease H family protein [Atopostipes sp.]|nr:ribonuclease H family protein [Atopostipes sp.]
MSKKYYAVRKGHHPGIYKNWDEAKLEVHGYPQALYQSFKSLEDAQNYMDTNPIENYKKDKKITSKPKINEHTIIAYVDGSFENSTKRYSFGAVLIQNTQIIKKLSRVGNNPKYQKSHQIAGEVFGALHAIQWAIQHHFKKIIIHYDYLGIEKWATGEWRANKDVSIDYTRSFQKLASKIKIEFVKVKAHSGVKYNELADQIAKNAFKNTEN